MLPCMLHALRLKGIECFQTWAKRMEGSLREQGMKLGKEEVMLGRFQKEKVVGVTGGGDH